MLVVLAELAGLGRNCRYAAGECRLVVARETYRLKAGDFVLLPTGAPHILRTSDSAPPIPIDDWHALHPKDEASLIRIDGDQPPLCITGGFFSFESLKNNPVFSVLPAVIHLSGDDPYVQEWLEPMTIRAARVVNETIASRGAISVEERELVIRTAEVRVTQLLLLVAEREGYDIRSGRSPIPDQPHQFATFQVNDVLLGLCPIWPIC